MGSELETELGIDWHTERRKLSELIDWEHNPRQMTEKQAADLTASLKRFGYVEPCAINLDGTLVGGHMRRRILLAKLHLNPDAEEDVRVPNRQLTQEEVAELNVRLNRNTAEWDFDKLGNIFDSEALVTWGFSPDEFAMGDDFKPVAQETQGRLDEKKKTKCPSCGHEF